MRTPIAWQLSMDFEGRLDGLSMNGSLRDSGGSAGGRGGLPPDELNACKATLKEVRELFLHPPQHRRSARTGAAPGTAAC